MAALTEMRRDDWEVIRSMPGNDKCIDCGAPKPDWGSPKLGILFCFDCSGRHRGLGTHISFVRSVTMDSWTEKQIAQMKAGGNETCRNFLTERKIDPAADIRHTYDTDAAKLYRMVLEARVEGKPEPKVLPPDVKSPVRMKKMEGFGSHAPEPPKKAGGALWLVVVPVIGIIGAWAWASLA